MTVYLKLKANIKKHKMPTDHRAPSRDDTRAERFARKALFCEALASRHLTVHTTVSRVTRFLLDSLVSDFTAHEVAFTTV